MRRLRDLALAGLLVACAFALGQWLRPAPAEADVVQRFGEQVASLADLLPLDARPGGQRLVEMDGQLIRSELSSSSLRPSEIMDQLDARAALEYVGLDLEPTVQKLRDADELTYAFRRPFRLDGDDGTWGVFGRLTAGPIAPFATILAPLVEGKGLGPSAEGGFVVLAMRAPDAERTDVWTMRFDEDFDPTAFVAAPGEDVAGGDLPGLDRYPGSQRVLRLSESAVTGVTHVVAYEGAGSVDEHLRHYARVLRAAGLRQAARSRRDGEGLLRYRGDEADVDVFVRRNPDREAGTLDLIQLRAP